MKNNSVLNHLKNILILPVNVTVVIPYLLNRFVWSKGFLNRYVAQDLIGFLLMIIGTLLFIYTVYLFKNKGQGTLAPWNPTQHLVISGPYRFMRNPMISGVLCILLGEALFFNSLIILIWSLLFFIINTIYFKFIEEPKLERQFGDAYAKYKAHVPRWWPRYQPYSAH